MKWIVTQGETPIDPQEVFGLRKRAIKTQAELNRAEAVNMAKAELALSIHDSSRTLELEWLMHLHHKMFGDVWNWAGTFRRTERNIGVPFTQVRLELIQLIENAKYRLKLSESREEIATYFHHGLLFIHPFPNGNGRWARRVTEAQCDYLSIRPPKWISLAPNEVANYRDKYLHSLRVADRGELAPLQRLLFD
ncbi:MAG TPA: mobile mystery protein B [Aquiluna sp.]